jgi:hypothetical protein
MIDDALWQEDPMTWNSNASHEEKVGTITDLARIICCAGRPTVNPDALEGFTLEEMTDFGYYADQILTIRIDPLTAMVQDEDMGGVARKVDGDNIVIFYGPMCVFTAQIVDSILAHDDVQYRSGQWEDHLMELGVHAIGILRDCAVNGNEVLASRA